MYTFLAYDAIDDYDKYVKANQYVLLADSYKDNSKKEEIYRKSIDIQKFHLTAWEGLTTLKLANKQLKSSNYLEFSKEIMDALKYYTRPMNDLLNAIKPKITDITDSAKFDFARIDALNQAEKATEVQSRQPDTCENIARVLLNKNTKYLASFSFDGENANTIVLDDKYDNSDIRVRYSLDGGKSWKQTNEHKIKLS